MEVLQTFFEVQWQVFLARDPVDQIAIASTIALVVLFPLLGWLWGYRDWKYHRARLENAQAEADEELKILKSDSFEKWAEASLWNPADWLTSADRERSEGNDEKATRLLRNGFDNVRTDLAKVTSSLAEHHMGQIDETEDRPHLGTAIRFARLSRFLDPDDKTHAQTLDELLLVWGDAPEAEDIPQLDDGSIPTDPVEATSAINSIIGRVQKLSTGGHYQVAERLAARAELIALRSGLFDQPVGCVARYYGALVLHNTGRSLEALEKIRTLLPVMERVQGKEHPNVLATRNLEAQILRATGASSEALEKVRALLPVSERVQGSEHQGLLANRFLEAQLLYATGESEEALEKVRTLLPVMKRAQGKEHPDVLTTRYLEAQLLHATGAPVEALEKVRSLLPVMERVQGKEHPDVLFARNLEAYVLHATGASAEAVQELDRILPVQIRVLGEPHSLVQETRDTIEEIRRNRSEK